MIAVSSEVEHQKPILAVTGSIPVPQTGCEPVRPALHKRERKLEDGERYDRSAAVWQLRRRERVLRLAKLAGIGHRMTCSEF